MSTIKSLNSTKDIHIPTVAPLSMTSEEIDLIMRIGFCYVRISDDSLLPKIETCLHVARAFFMSSPEEKAKWQVKQVTGSHARHEGCALRSQGQNAHVVEQLFFEPDVPLSLYAKEHTIIQEINDFYLNKIAFPLLKAIFNRLNISNNDFADVTDGLYRSFSFASYPTINADRYTIRLNAHKDFGLLTILFIDEPGLEVKYQHDWIAIPPEPKTVIVNLGNALELMTAGACHSALHRVMNTVDNRMSAAFFINPNYQRPVKNYIHHSVISPTGALFFKQQFRDYYAVEQ